MGSTATCHNDAEWRCFESEVIQMAGKGNILLCGDMNARTGSKNDYIKKDTNFFVPSPIPYEKYF